MRVLFAGFTSNTLMWRAGSAFPLVFALLCALLANFVWATRLDETEGLQFDVPGTVGIGEKTKNILTRSIGALHVDDVNAPGTLDKLNAGYDVADIAKTQAGACDIMLASMKAWLPDSPDRQALLNAIAVESKNLTADELKPTWKDSRKIFKKLECPKTHDSSKIETFRAELKVAKKVRAVQQLHLSVAAVMGDVLLACLPSKNLKGDFPTPEEFDEAKTFVVTQYQSWSLKRDDASKHWDPFKKSIENDRLCDAMPSRRPFNNGWEGKLIGLEHLIMNDPWEQIQSRWWFKDVLEDLEDLIVCNRDGQYLARKAMQLRSTWAHAYKYKMYDEPQHMKDTKDLLMIPCIDAITGGGHRRQRQPQQQHEEISDPSSSFRDGPLSLISQQVSDKLSEKLDPHDKEDPLTFLKQACKSHVAKDAPNPCTKPYRKLSLKCHPDKRDALKTTIDVPGMSDDQLETVTNAWMQYINQLNDRCEKC